MGKKDVLGAWNITGDNLRFVFGNLDFGGPANFREIFARFGAQKEVARRFNPQKLPIVQHLEKLTRQYKGGQISDKFFFKQVKKVSDRNGLNPNLAERVQASFNAFGLIMPVPQPFKVKVPLGKPLRGRRKPLFKVEPIRVKMRSKHPKSAQGALNFMFGRRK